MCKFLFWIKNYVYKACNPTIPNLCIMTFAVQPGADKIAF
jgi:hypothetical protein